MTFQRGMGVNFLENDGWSQCGSGRDGFEREGTN